MHHVWHGRLPYLILSWSIDYPEGRAPRREAPKGEAHGALARLIGLKQPSKVPNCWTHGQHPASV